MRRTRNQTHELEGESQAIRGSNLTETVGVSQQGSFTDETRESATEEYNFDRDSEAHRDHIQADPIDKEIEVLRLKVRLAELGAAQHTGGGREFPQNTWHGQGIKIPPFTDRCDPRAILLLFERQCRLRSIPEDQWMSFLTPHLAGKAMTAYNRLPNEQANEYFSVKAAVLEIFNLTPAQHLKAFRATRRHQEETYLQCFWRMRESLNSWISGSNVNTFEELKNLLLTEQFNNMLPSDLRIWLLDQGERDSERIAILADKYVDTRRASYDGGQTREERRENRPTYHDRLRDNRDHRSYVRDDRPKFRDTKPRETYTDYKRNESPTGAPKTKPNIAGRAFHIKQRNCEAPKMHTSTIKINGRTTSCLRDTGATKTIIRRDLTLPGQLTGDTIRLQTLTQNVYDQPLAMVKMERDGYTETVEVAVANKLDVGVLLGNDLGYIMQTKVSEGAANTVVGKGGKIFANHENAYVSGGLINDRYGKILKDTGSAVNLVRTDYVHPSQYTGKRMQISTIANELLSLKQTKITVEDACGKRKVIALAYNELPFSLLLGVEDESNLCPVNQCFFVTNAEDCETTSHSRVKTQENAINGPIAGRTRLKESGTLHPHPTGKKGEKDDRITPSKGSANEETTESCDNRSITTRTRSKTLRQRGPFLVDKGKKESLISDDQGHKGTYEGQRKEDHLTNNARTPLQDANEGEGTLSEWGNLELKDLEQVTDRREFEKQQKADDSLNELWKLTREGPKKGVQFLEKEGLLLRIWTNKKQKMEYQQLVVPKKLRNPVLTLAHDAALAGHLGIRKTQQRVFRNFYWPRAGSDIKEFVSSCPHCQMTRRPDKNLKAPLINIPAIGEPFRRTALDIVGPLPPCESGKKYILTLSDIATHYPEAVAIENIEAETIVRELITIFSRLGFPTEVLTDCGTQFKSQLMNGLWNRSGVKAKFTSPYHPQTNGQLERAHSSLKHMLRTLVEKYGNDWDELIPYALFAYREAVNETTGFSPFELLFGRRVRGPLDILHHAWSGDKNEKKSVVAYFQELRKKMHTCSRIAVENAKKAKEGQKRWYDKGARKRAFEPGQKVLILKPVKQSSLDVAWTGPYVIDQKFNDVNYAVELEGGVKQTYHINMLKAWRERPPTVALLTCERGEGESPTAEEGPHLGPSLTERQKAEVSKLLNDYGEVITDKLGFTKLVQHDIQLDHDDPIALRPYRVPWAARQEIQKQIEEMLQQGIIEHSHSKYAAPIVLAAKKDGTSRFCIDFRRVNEITKPDPYPTPCVEDMLTGLNHANFLTKIDLLKAFFQIGLTERAKEIAAFRTPTGLYNFKVMPMGTKNSSSSFVRLMHKVLEGLEDFTRCYVDDILIFSPTWEAHMKHIRAVLDKLKWAGLTAKPSKCQIAVGQVNFLGHQIGKGHMAPDQAKVEAIKNWPVPTTKKQVRSFLGTISYYRKYIKNFSSLASSLTELTKGDKRAKINWTKACNDAFDRLKIELTTAPILISPDPNKEFFLQTDASNVGIGAILGQKVNNEEHPVAFLSRKLNAAEKNYSTIEKEALAMTWALEKCRPYVYGRRVHLQTDHNPLTWIFRMQDKNRRILRWAMALQEYDLQVTYKKGEDHANADGLSRIWAE